MLAGTTVTAYATAAPGATPRALGHAITDASGDFSISVDCAAGASGVGSVYFTAAGGAPVALHSDAPFNDAIQLVAALGPCAPIAGTLTINELTTVAAAYALNRFTDGTGIAGSAPGLPNALTTAIALADPRTGALATTLPLASQCAGAASPTNCEAVGKLNALANAVSACALSGSPTAAACEIFFSCATAGAADDGPGSCRPTAAAIIPTDTWQALLAIAQNPGLVSASGLYRATTASSAYAPVPAGAPGDWTLSVAHTGGGLSEPTALAIDAAGNVWVASYNSAVSEFDPSGAALSPASGYTGGGLEESYGLAIDAAGHVWICNEQSSAQVNSGLGSVTEMAADGTILSAPDGFTGGGLDFPEALTADAAGHIWIVNYGNSTLTELASDGSPLSPLSGYTGGGLSFPVAIAAAPNGTLWVANQGNDRISAFMATGVAVTSPGGYAGGGLAVPQGVALDQRGNVWVSNYYGDSVSAFNNLGVALSPVSGYPVAASGAPGGIAIDGAGQVWVANFQGASVSEVAGAGAAIPGAALSPATGFTARSLLQPFALAVDASGNLWVSNSGNDTVTEFIGLAAPVVTPLRAALD